MTQIGLIYGANAATGDGRLTQDDVFSIQRGRIYLDGKPFAEISFNKFDLFWQLWWSAKKGNLLDDSSEIVRKQDLALSELHAMGFKTIRIFGMPWGNWEFSDVYDNPGLREKVFYAAVTKTLDLCDKYGLRVVYSLDTQNFNDRRLLSTGKWDYGQEHMRDLLKNPESRSRKRLYTFLEEFIPRMKHRKTIAMWEVGNEITLAADIGNPKDNNLWNGSRMPSSLHVANFYRDIQVKLKQLDPLRLVNNGGSNMRVYQWNIYQGRGYKTDTFEEQIKAFDLMLGKSGIDFMDIHHYPNNRPGGGYPIKDSSGNTLVLDLHGYQSIAAHLQKPLMIGELGVLPKLKSKNPKVWEETPQYFESFEDVQAAKPWVQRALDQVVEAKVPLVYWWSYSSDRPEDKKREYEDFKKGRDDVYLSMIMEANRRLKEALGVIVDK